MDRARPTAWRARIRRALDFTMMDQLVDFAHYEDAVRAGGAAVMVKVRGDDAKAAVVRGARGQRRPLRELLRSVRHRGDLPLAGPRARHRRGHAPLTRQALTSDSSTSPSPSRRRTSATSSES